MSTAAYNNQTTADEVADRFAEEIKGKTVIVTGASWGGLGGETCKVLAKHGVKLVILCGRSEAKLIETEKHILDETPNANLRKLVLDLASLDSVRRAAEEVHAYEENIDGAILNAGIMAGPYELTEDGFESQFGTNHLGHFLFVNKIKAKILASASPRVVCVSSGGHRISDIRYEDLGFSKGETYEKWTAYGQSKTANILTAVGIAERWGIPAFGVHPGEIWTNLARSLSTEDKIAMGFLDSDGNVPKNGKYTFKTLNQGVATHIVAAFDPSIAGNAPAYLSDAKISNDTAAPYALNKTNARKLWALSEELLGETF